MKLNVLITLCLLLFVWQMAIAQRSEIDRTRGYEYDATYRYNFEDEAGKATRNLDDQRRREKISNEISLEMIFSRVEIKEAQRRLKEAGYFEGEIDGLISYETEAAIEDFQIDNDLEVTGQLNFETMDSLDVKWFEIYPD